jgi:hypothetical protein
MAAIAPDLEGNLAFARSLLDYDPTAPSARFFATATEMAAAVAAGGAVPVPWPAGLAPIPAPPAAPPDPSSPLPKADVVVVTWTSAEAATLAALMTPGAPVSAWFEYKSNVAAFIPKVTGGTAPFNDKGQPRYYQSLGLYYPITLVGKRVLCFKSGLHLDYDGPRLPIVDLWRQIIAESGAELIITTGTGGGIGANVLLGDVIVAAQTVFDCAKQFENEPFAKASYDTSPPPADLTGLLTPSLLAPNASRVARSKLPGHPDGLPAFLYPGSTAVADPKIVTTDFFAFDNTTDTDHLQALGNVCDMGDATLGLAISQLPDPPRWAAIRNASDPQIDGSLSPQQQQTTAGNIYKHFGPFTTAASVLAAWSMICRTYPPAPSAGVGAMAHVAKPPVSLSLASLRRLETQIDPSHLILQIAASTELEVADVTAASVPVVTLRALTAHLQAIDVDPLDGAVTYRKLGYQDEAGSVQELFLAHVSSDSPEAFRGTYLYAGEDLIAKVEFASS